MIQFLGLLKNPLTKIIAEKTFGAIQHKLNKDAIIKKRELDHVQNVDVQYKRKEQNYENAQNNYQKAKPIRPADDDWNVQKAN